MRPLPSDPLAQCGIIKLGNRLRSGETTTEAVTRAYLDRIAALNPKLNAFVYVAEESAMVAAQGIDLLLKSGTDLGPLMGIPVAIKDLLAVDGMPTQAGSRLNVKDLIGPEGSFVKAMKRAGCIILGKTRTTEFAAGAQQVSHPTPWNPWDPKTHRTPGGSSSGSAVAQATGLCSFAIGSDTGGSVRLPAALCGVFGLKTSVGLLPLDGVLPLSPAMDTLGIFTNTALDAALVFEVLTGKSIPPAPTLKGLRIGRPAKYFFEDLDHRVEVCIENALSQAAEAGAEFTSVEFADAEAVGEIFSKMVPTDLITTLGIDQFLNGQALIDPVVVDRVSPALDLKAVDYVALTRLQKELAILGKQRIESVDAWVTPTTKTLPVPLSECNNAETAAAFTSRATQITRFGNVYGFCASSIPIIDSETNLPVGIQLHCGHGQDARLLSISLAFEKLLGMAPKTDISATVNRIHGFPTSS